MTKLSPLTALRWAYVAFIAMASVLAIRSALAGEGEGHHPPAFVLVLAATELVGALALLFRATERAACGVLLVIYVIAGVVSVASGDLLAPLRFLYYAATAILIVATPRQRLRAETPA